MKPETIKNHIDKNIVSLLENMDYEEVCKYISDISTRFNSRISDVDVSNLTSIENCSDARVRYTAYYVFFSNKRIQDILRIEKKKINKNRILNFKTLIFKERLLSCSKIENTINFKYKKLI
jgi:hypothetical protein